MYWNNYDTQMEKCTSSAVCYCTKLPKVQYLDIWLQYMQTASEITCYNYFQRNFTCPQAEMVPTLPFRVDKLKLQL